MPKFEIEVDDKGEFVGQLPTEIDAILKRVEITAHGTGFRSGQGKAAEDAKKQLDEAIRAERARLEAEAPVKQAKFAQMEEDYKSLQTRLLENERANNQTLKEREEAHARELLARADTAKKMSTRIHDLTKSHLRNEARAQGVREDALDILTMGMHGSIGYDDDMRPFVKDADGQPRMVQGKPMTVEAFVKEFVDGHQFARKPTGAQGGGARGGASFHGHTSNVSADAARARVEAGDRSSDAINDLYEATRRKAS